MVLPPCRLPMIDLFCSSIHHIASFICYKPSISSFLMSPTALPDAVRRHHEYCRGVYAIRRHTRYLHFAALHRQNAAVLMMNTCHSGIYYITAASEVDSHHRHSFISHFILAALEGASFRQLEYEVLVNGIAAKYLPPNVYVLVPFDNIRPALPRFHFWPEGDMLIVS